MIEDGNGFDHMDSVPQLLGQKLWDAESKRRFLGGADAPPQYIILVFYFIKDKNTKQTTLRILGTFVLRKFGDSALQNPQT